MKATVPGPAEGFEVLPRVRAATSADFGEARNYGGERRSWSAVWAGLAGGRARFVALRYGAALLAAAEALTFARLLGPEDYGRYAFVIQTAAVLVVAGAGSASGYVFAFYRDRDDDLEAIYLAGALIQFLAGTLAVTALLSLWNTDLAFSGMLLLIMSPHLAAEPLLRVRNEFSTAVFGKALGSLGALFAVLGCFAAGTGRVEFEWALVAAMAGSAAGFGAYYCGLMRRHRELFAWRKLRAGAARPGWGRRYFERILRPGLPLNLATVVFLLFTFADRFFVERYRSPGELGIYSLAWQLAQGSVLMLTSLNLISGVKLGERLTGPVEELECEIGRQLKFTAAAGALALALLGAGSWLLERTVYRDYEGIMWLSLAIGAGYLAVNTARAVSIVLFYAGRNLELTLAHAAVLAVSVGGNVLALRFELPYQAPVVITSSALTGLSIWLLFFTRKVAGEMTHSATVTV